MARSGNPAVRFFEVLKYYLGGIYRQGSEKPIFLWAQAIAFKVLITVVPVLFLTVAILGRVLQYENPFETVSSYIREFLPGYRSEGLIGALDALQQASGTLTLIGIAGSLFFAMTLFTTLRVVVSSVFQEEWHDQRTILGGYIFDMRMAAQVGLFFLLTITLTAGLQFLDKADLSTVDRVLSYVGLESAWFKQGWRTGIRWTLYMVPFLLSVAMFFQLMFFVPIPHPPKRSAVIGALTTAVLWELAKIGFTMYATAGRFEYRVPEQPTAGGSAVGALGDTFGLILAFVFWVYYSGVVLCIGAIVALLNEKRYRLRKKRKQAEVANAETALSEAVVPVDEPPPAVEAEGGQRE